MIGNKQTRPTNNFWGVDEVKANSRSDFQPVLRKVELEKVKGDNRQSSGLQKVKKVIKVRKVKLSMTFMIILSFKLLSNI